MATLGSIRSAIFPAAVPARPLTPQELERDVTWVRVLKAGGAGIDALEAGDLVILPASAVPAPAPDGDAMEELAARLVTVQCAALLLCGDGPDDVARARIDALAAAAHRAGVPALRLSPADPPALERSAIAYLVNQQAEVDRRAAELDGQLARLALAGGGLSTLAAAIGEFLGRAVAIENPGGETLAIHAPAEPAAAAAAAARYLSRTLGRIAALRVVIPAAPGERGSGGRLLLLGDEPARELERVAGERVAGVLGLELARVAALDQVRDELRRAEPLPADGPPWVGMMARQGPAEPAGSDRVSTDRVDEPRAQAARERIRAGLRAIAPARRLRLRGTAESLELRMVAAVAPDDAGGAALATEIAAYLGRTVALSRPFPDAVSRPAAEAAARSTLEAAEAMGQPPRLAYAARLPAYQLLGSLDQIPGGSRQARLLLAPILASRPASRRQRLETLRAVLDSGGFGEAAAVLGVHRNTIAYRIEAIERETGWNLHDPDLRLALRVAIRIAEHDGA